MSTAMLIAGTNKKTLLEDDNIQFISTNKISNLIKDIWVHKKTGHHEYQSAE